MPDHGAAERAPDEPERQRRQGEQQTLRDEGQPPASAGSGVEERPVEVGDVEFVYKLEGKRNDLPIFELSRVLDAVGTIIQEGNHIVNPKSDELSVKVRPFHEGSFLTQLRA